MLPMEAKGRLEHLKAQGGQEPKKERTGGRPCTPANRDLWEQEGGPSGALQVLLVLICVAEITSGQNGLYLHRDRLL